MEKLEVCLHHYKTVNIYTFSFSRFWVCNVQD